MKSLSIIILSWFIIFLTGCSKDKSSIENDLKKENLKGDVVLVSTKNDGFISLKLFNDRGMLIKSFSGSSGKDYTLEESIYDNDIKVIVKLSLNLGVGLSNSEFKYSYDANGKLEYIISQNSNNNSKDFNQNFTYNKDGELIKEDSKYDDMTISKEYFYSENKLDSIIYTNKIGDIVVNNTTEIYEKDKQINKHYDIESNENKVLTDITFYKKNNRGDFIEEVLDEFNSNGNKIKTTTKIYEYNYDEKGNWIQKRTIEDGVMANTENRTIIYKGGETSTYLNQIEKIIASVESENNSANSHSNNSNSSSNNYQRENNTQKQLVNCRDCGGQGILICKECSGNGMVKCGNCSNGTIVDQVNGGRVTCYVCNGTMRKNCNKCRGKGNDGKCYKCGGRGQVSE